MRKILLATGEIYHVFNRGIEKRTTFKDTREYNRALLTLSYYRFANPPLGLGQALDLEVEKRNFLFSRINQNKKLVEIIAYCLMPNHFHLLLKQLQEEGIKKFLSNFSNSYTRYFNTKNKRLGPLFQGIFKAIRIEDDEQLIHVSRYIHINPAVSFVVKKEDLETYPYSSLPEFLGNKRGGFCNTKIVRDNFFSVKKYKDFVYDQIDYAKKLESIKHLILE